MRQSRKFNSPRLIFDIILFQSKCMKMRSFFPSLVTNFFGFGLITQYIIRHVILISIHNFKLGKILPQTFPLKLEKLLIECSPQIYVGNELCGTVKYYNHVRKYEVSCGNEGIVGKNVKIIAAPGQYLTLCEVQVMSDPTNSGNQIYNRVIRYITE